MKEKFILSNHCVLFIRCVCKMTSKWVVVLEFFVLSQIASNLLFPLLFLSMKHLILFCTDILLWCNLIVPQKTHGETRCVCRPSCLHSQAKKRKREALIWRRIPMCRSSHDYVLSFVHLSSKRYLLNTPQGPSSEPVAPMAWCRVRKDLRTKGS